MLLSAATLPLALLLPTSPLSLAPRASLLSPTPRASGAKAFRRAFVALCADADGAAKISGKVVVQGDGIVCRDQESDAWWRATVRDVRGSQVLVHWTGCDEAWDQWMEADSPDVMLMDSDVRGREESAFQSESLEASMDDDELLAEYRRKRWDDNARWQLTTFVQSQLGEWAGEVELYEQDGNGGVRKRVGPWTPECTCEAVVASNTEVEISDSLPSVAAELAISRTMDYEVFRPEVGNMAVASGFSLSSAAGAASGAAGWLFEVAVGEGDRRVRAKFLYRADADSDADGSSAPRMSLASLAMVREARAGKSFLTSPSDADDDADEIASSPGRGLYDPPPGSKMGYCSLYAEGGITLVFPTSVDAQSGGFMSMDWIAGRMRYQLDRKFKKLDGSLSSLELTEIQKSDAEVIAPDFPHQGGGDTA